MTRGERGWRMRGPEDGRSVVEKAWVTLGVTRKQTERRVGNADVVPLYGY